MESAPEELHTATVDIKKFALFLHGEQGGPTKVICSKYNTVLFGFHNSPFFCSHFSFYFSFLFSSLFSLTLFIQNCSWNDNDSCRIESVIGWEPLLSSLIFFYAEKNIRKRTEYCHISSFFHILRLPYLALLFFYCEYIELRMLFQLSVLVINVYISCL